MKKSLIVRVPGRINLIGEHTDYSLGLVLPAAINRYLKFTLSEKQRKTMKLKAIDLDEVIEVSLSSNIPRNQNIWSNYVLGIYFQMIRGGPPIGLDASISSEIPIGAGLSSSAALIVAAGLSFMKFFNLEIDDLNFMRLCRQAEMRYTGVQCGIMDYFGVFLAKANHALFLDCSTLEFAHIPLNFEKNNVKILVIDSRIKRELTSSNYNVRQNECAKAIEILNAKGYQIEHPSMIKETQLGFIQDILPEELYKRMKHVVTENLRVKEAVAALNRKDLQTLGNLIRKSHESLSHDYKVSIPEIDHIVEIANEHPGVLGARIMGGGFGGAALCLAYEDAVEELSSIMEEKYYKPKELEPGIYDLEVVDGAKYFN